ncbi:MAG: hypothetical protein ACE5IO_07500 [Thermoplasmata archaeon]
MATVTTGEQISRAIREEDITTLSDLLDRHIRSSGWPAARGTLKTALLARHQRQWFAINRLILRTIDAEELIGYDGDIIEELDSLHDVRSLSDLKTSLHNLLVERVRTQIAAAGSDLFFDPDAMSSKSSSVLVAEIVEMRRARFINSAVPLLKLAPRFWSQYPPLWTTCYGLNVLGWVDSINDWSEEHEQGSLDSLMQRLEQVQSEVGATENSDVGTDNTMSERMRQLSCALANRYHNCLRIVRYSYDQPWDTIFHSGYKDPYQFVEDVCTGAILWNGESDLYPFHDDSDPETLTQGMRKRMLKGAIKALSMIGNKESVELLAKLLSVDGTENALRFIETMSYVQYYENRDELHEYTLESMTGLDRESIQDHVIDFVNRQDYSVKTNKDGKPYPANLTNTSARALRLATGLLLKDSFDKVAEKLTGLRDAPELGDFAAKSLEDREWAESPYYIKSNDS